MNLVFLLFSLFIKQATSKISHPILSQAWFDFFPDDSVTKLQIKNSRITTTENQYYIYGCKFTGQQETTIVLSNGIFLVENCFFTQCNSGSNTNHKAGVIYTYNWKKLVLYRLCVSNCQATADNFQAHFWHANSNGNNPAVTKFIDCTLHQIGQSTSATAEIANIEKLQEFNGINTSKQMKSTSYIYNLISSNVEIFYSTLEKITNSLQTFPTLLKFSAGSCMMKFTNIIQNNYKFPIINNDNTNLYGFRCVILGNNPQQGQKSNLISGQNNPIVSFMESYIAENGDHLQAELKMNPENSFSRTNANLKRDDCDGFASTILKPTDRICQPSFENKQEHFLLKLVIVNIVSIPNNKK